MKVSSLFFLSFLGGLPGGLMAKTLCSQCKGLIPGQGTRSHMLQLRQIDKPFFLFLKLLGRIS